MFADEERTSDTNPRHPNGRYRKGHCGNRRGRPRKQRRVFTNHQMRADILNAMEEEVMIAIDGKQQKLPRIVLVYQQLVRKGAAGDVRCMFKAIDLRQQLLTDHTAALNELAELAVRARRAYRDRPQDFTDEDLEALHEIGSRLRDPDRLF